VDVLREARKIPPENLALHLADLIWHFAGCQSAVQAVGGMLRGLDVNDFFSIFSGWWFGTCFFHNIWDNPSH
jgi:hypothetical protein